MMRTTTYVFTAVFLLWGLLACDATTSESGDSSQQTPVNQPGVESGSNGNDNSNPGTETPPGPSQESEENQESDSNSESSSEVESESESEPENAAGEPLFESIGVYETLIEANEDPADVYYPQPADLEGGDYAFPIALLLQGAKVDKSHYAQFATVVASYGFVVVVPNHESLTFAGRGLYPQQSQVPEVLAHMQNESSNANSPLYNSVDTETLVLLGHSYGGACGLYSLGNNCQFPFCVGGFNRPTQLAGGAFWGTNLTVPVLGNVSTTQNDSIPVALIQGTLDSMAQPSEALATYNEIQDSPKMLINVVGANHYGMCDTNNPPGAEEDSVAPELEQDLSAQTIARWSALFLRAHVLNDRDAWSYVHETGPSLDEYVVVQESSL